jgi:hypothetical protein
MGGASPTHASIGRTGITGARIFDPVFVTSVILLIVYLLGVTRHDAVEG